MCTVISDIAEMVSRVSYAYQDESAYLNNNLGVFDDQEIVDAWSCSPWRNIFTARKRAQIWYRINRPF